MNKKRLLFIGGGPFMPLSQPMETLKHKHLSTYFSGDIITPIAHLKHKKIKEINEFYYHPIVLTGNSLVKNLKFIFKCIFKSIQCIRKNGKYDVIISSNPLLTGLVALVIGKLYRTPVIIEVNGNFESAFKYENIQIKQQSFTGWFKEKFSMVTIPFVLKRAQFVKLLAKNQLDVFKIPSNKIHTFCFPDFVPIERFINFPTKDMKYILLLGYPWYLKGVDILIKAFNEISDEFPEYRLKIFGWCPKGREYFINLTKDNHKIELNEAVYLEEVIPIMANCSLYVLASRTEAMGRVLIEAMACKKPIIASKVGGVHSIIINNYNGLFFESENINDLSNKIRHLLSHPEVSKKLSENAFQYATKNFSEENYIKNFLNMIHEVLRIKKIQS